MSARLLVVEDDQAVAAATRERLQAEGFAVDLAEDGEDGLAKILAGAYDLVITDLSMPVMTGAEMLDRAFAARGSFKAIVTAGYAQDPRPASWSHVRHMTKPVAMGDLVATVRAMIADA